MPLFLAESGEEAVIRRVGGSPELKKHLEDMGFTVGGAVTVMNAIGGKWKLPVLCSLSANGASRYNELLHNVQGISNTMLSHDETP